MAAVKAALHAQLAGWRPGRSPTPVHASDMTRGEPAYCIRAAALLDLAPQPPARERLSTAQAVTFAIGRLVQDQVIHWLSDAAVAVTDWRCLACGTLAARCPRPRRCAHCPCAAFAPQEIRFESAVSGISGGFDVLFREPGGRLRIVEIKTIESEAFKRLAAPLAEHRLRTNLYLRIAAESGDPWTERLDLATASVLYVSKGGWGTLDPTLGRERFSPFKEFAVARDDAATQALHERAARLKEFRRRRARGDRDAGVPQGICTTRFAKRAGMCRMASLCFSGDYPPNDHGGL